MEKRVNRSQVLGVAILFIEAGQNWRDNFGVRLQKAKARAGLEVCSIVGSFLNAMMVTTTRDEHPEGKG